jgi:hypothetical protein
VFSLILLLISVAIYFAPSIVAVRRSHHQSMAIIALNILTGWTFIGWVAALVWSLTATYGRQEDSSPLDAAGTDYDADYDRQFGFKYADRVTPKPKAAYAALSDPSPLTADRLRRSGGN